MIAALTNQILFTTREIMYFSRRMSRFYYCRQKLYCMNNFLLEKHSVFSFVVNTWVIPRTCYSTENKINFSNSLTKDKIKKIVSKFNSEERELFLKTLEEYKSEEDRAGYQRQLAAFRWCNKLGRPSKIPSLKNVDPTGTYCPVPEDWLMRKYEPSTKDLILVTISNAIPFIGFGFLDNFIMIVAGDQIEMMLSKKFPISTMTAAALGNTISDIIGIGSVDYVERFAQSVGFKAPKLTPMQLNLRKTKAAANMGRVIGVTVGCIIGMTPIPIFSYFHNND
ncbi:uncharacterized protein LOC551215 isoform X4 [Apis mellifera]|uniref:Uncharacterized protein LOC551215 isoform X4 n=1 Tax=Apis mellifera TaxID=7460 RepID=A0A7M7L294_APIME|nr:uncharacterized protein LOC551215 isoform X4 [Apis mellifera]|eukprot:XP_026295166.1 uncharacterized protein LOC551215 isoform X4 [Apis mellifera]